ncbi:MAG TPA: hypothetical protein VFB23_08885 [Candidatus Acidoferrales bacterium]|nr:hypothetical protein [Candidatus Acidoferrales bacterium]
MQKAMILMACCCFVFVAGWAFGQQTQTALDSSAWTQVGKVDDLARIMYVKGYVDGYADGDTDMEKISAVLMKDVQIDASAKALVAPLENRMSDVLGFGKNGEVTIGTTMDAMTTFYTDYRNAPVCWRDALRLSAWSLNADTPTDGDLALARKRGADKGCR